VSIPPLPQYVFIAWYLVKHRDFTFTLSTVLVSFAAITLCVASQRVFIVVSVYFVIDSVRKLLDTPDSSC
jgi:succinate-acetate transporter protein